MKHDYLAKCTSCLSIVWVLCLADIYVINHIHHLFVCYVCHLFECYDVSAKSSRVMSHLFGCYVWVCQVFMCYICHLFQCHICHLFEWYVAGIIMMVSLCLWLVSALHLSLVWVICSSDHYHGQSVSVACFSAMSLTCLSVM